MADTKPRHTNNINILPGTNIEFDQEDQNITINAIIPPTPATSTCFPGGTFYLGGSPLGDASDINPGTDPTAPIASWARMRGIMGCLPITGPVIVKVRRGVYVESLEITGKIFSRSGSISVMATDEDALGSSPYYLSHIDAITGEFPPVVRTVQSATNNTVVITGVSGLTKDQLMGRRIRLIGGPSPGGSDIMRAVWANDDSVLTLDREWFTPPSPGAEIVIEQPGVEFQDGEEAFSFGDSQRPYFIGGCIGEDQPNTDGQTLDQIQLVGIKFRTHGLVTEMFETFGTGGKITGNKGMNIRFTCCEEQTQGPEWINNEHIIASNKYYWPEFPANYLDVGYGLVIGEPIDLTVAPPEPTATLIIRKIPVDPFAIVPFVHNAFSYDSGNVITVDGGIFGTFNPPEPGPIVFHFTLTHPDLSTEELTMTYPVDTVGPPGEIIIPDLPLGTYIITEHVDDSEPTIGGVPWNAESIVVVSASPSTTDLTTPLVDVSATIELIEDDITIVTFEDSLLTPFGV